MSVLNSSEESSKKPRIACSFCEKHYSKSQDMLLHVKNKHFEEAQALNWIKCNNCLAILPSSQSMLRHTQKKHKDLMLLKFAGNEAQEVKKPQNKRRQKKSTFSVQEKGETSAANESYFHKVQESTTSESASAIGDQNEPVSRKENKSNLSLSDSTTDGESVNNIEHVNELDESLKEFEAEISTLKRSIYLKTVEKLIFQSAQTSLTNGASRKFEEIVKKLSYEQNMLSICISQQEELQKLKQQLDGQHLKHEEKVLAQYAETQQLQLEHQHQDVKHAFCQEQSSVQEAAVRQIGIEDKTQPGASNETYESTNKEKTNSKSVLLQISFRKNSIEHKPIVLEPSICKKVEVKAALQCKTVMLQPMLLKPTPVKRKFYPDFNTDQSLSKIQRLETGNRCNVSLEPINRSRDDLFNRPLRPRITYRKLQSNKIIRFVEVPMELTTKPNFFPPVGPYKCEGCGKFVRTNAEFVEHVKKIHAKDLDEEVVAIMDRHLLASSA